MRGHSYTPRFVANSDLLPVELITLYGNVTKKAMTTKTTAYLRTGKKIVTRHGHDDKTSLHDICQILGTTSMSREHFLYTILRSSRDRRDFYCRHWLFYWDKDKQIPLTWLEWMSKKNGQEDYVR